MSYKARQAPEDQPDENRCSARGCPCRATTKFDNMLRCSFHDGQEHERWPAITEKLIEFDWLRGFAATLSKTDRWRDWRTVATEFFAEHYPDLVPTETHREQYLYRLHQEIRHRVGVSNRKPGPYVPAATTQGYVKRGPVGMAGIPGVA
jgi:hypothetical protein